MTTIGERIKNRRKQLRITVDELANKLDKDRATIYRYENGDIENLPITIVAPLAEALDTSVEYIMGWSTSDSLTPVKIVYDDYFPLHFYSGLSAGSFEELMSAEPDSIVYVPIKFQLKKDHLNAFKVNGTSMDNIIVDGSIVVTEDTHNNAIPISDGDVAVVFYNGEATVKKVYNQEDRILLMPDSTDKAHLPITIVKEDTEIYIIGKVIWHMNPDDISKIY